MRLRRHRRPEVHDVVTPTDGERRRADQVSRQHRYYVLMAICLACVLFGFFAPAPILLRGLVLVVGAVLPPIAAIVANAGREG